MATTTAFRGILHASARAWVNCWKITPISGDPIRITSGDVPVWIGSEEFLPSDETDPLQSQGGADAQAIRRESALKEANSAVEGLVSSSRISEADLQSGRYRGARIDHYVVDARFPFAGQLYKRWVMSDLRWSTDGRWSADIVSSDTAPLGEKRGEVTSKLCRNQLFSATGCDTCGRARTTAGSDPLVRAEWQIGLASGNYPIVQTVTSQRQIRVGIPRIAVSGFSTTTISGTLYQVVSHASNHYLCGTTTTAGTPMRMPVAIRNHATGAVNRIYTLAEVVSATQWRAPWTSASAYATDGYASFEPEAGWFDFGKLTWRTGDNVGLSFDIESSTAFTASASGSFAGYIDLTLTDAPALPIAVSDTMTLETGCDRRSITCLDKFANLVNFRGEPTMNSAAELAETPNAS